MSIMKTAFLIFCSFFILSTGFGDGKARVAYLKPKNSNEIMIEKELKESDAVKSVLNLINENFNLPADLYFSFGEEEGPLYAPEENKIFVPYAFIQEVKDRFTAANYSESGVNVETATTDALIHTLFHELAYAFISMYDLPVVGKEEDAADGLAAVLAIDFFEDGQEIAISAADLFGLESEDRDALDDEDFRDEHSLDIQRYYNTLCYVYGSHPQKYDYLQEEDGFSEERAERCIEEYENLSRNWLILLKSHMKDN